MEKFYIHLQINGIKDEHFYFERFNNRGEVLTTSKTIMAMIFEDEREARIVANRIQRTWPNKFKSAEIHDF